MEKEEDITKDFGLIVRELRQKNNISQEKLAERSSLDRSYISEVENGYKTPTIITVSKIGRALGVRPSRIFQLVEQHSNIDY